MEIQPTITPLLIFTTHLATFLIGVIVGTAIGWGLYSWSNKADLKDFPHFPHHQPPGKD